MFFFTTLHTFTSPLPHHHHTPVRLFCDSFSLFLSVSARLLPVHYTLFTPHHLIKTFFHTAVVVKALTNVVGPSFSLSCTFCSLSWACLIQSSVLCFNVLFKILGHYCKIPRLQKIVVIWNNVHAPVPEKLQKLPCQVPRLMERSSVVTMIQVVLLWQ